MELRKLLTAGIAGAALLVGMGGAASAATVSFSTVLGPTLATSLPSTISISKFDTTLGTLTAAQLTLSLTNIGSVTATNLSTTNTYSLTSASASVFVSVGLVSPFLISFVTSTANASGLPQNLAPSPGIGSSLSFTGLTDSPTPVTTSLSLAQMAAFSGVGANTLSLNLTKSASVTGSSDGGINVAYSGESTTTVTLAVEYTYNINPPNDAPEPASLALLGASVAGIAAMRRRRKAN